MGWTNAGGWSGRGWAKAAATGDSAAATNFLARTTGLNATHTNAYKTLLNGLTTDGFFDGSGVSTLLDALYVTGTADSTTAKLNLVKNANNLGTFPASPTFTADAGVVSDGTNCLTTGFTPSTAGGHMALNSTHLMCYDITSDAVGSGQVAMGVVNVANTSCIEIIEQYTDNSFFGRANELGASLFSNTNHQGCWVVSRTASNAVAVYKNANTTAAASQTTASVALPDQDLLLLCLRDNTGTLVAFSSGRTYAAFSYGAGLTSTQSAALANRVNTFLATVGTSNLW